MLAKKYRLTTKKDFDDVYQNGRAYTTPYFKLFYRKQKQGNMPAGFMLPRFGFVASKKFGKATLRNKAKRRLREIVRLEHANLSKDFEVIFICYNGLMEADFDEVQNVVKKLFKKLDFYNEHKSKVNETDN